MSAAAAVLAVDRAPQGGEHIKQLLVGSILTVTPARSARLAALYALDRRAPLARSAGRCSKSRSTRTAPRGAAARCAGGTSCFYVTFGVVVTSSVRHRGRAARLRLPGRPRRRARAAERARCWAGLVDRMGARRAGERRRAPAASWTWDLPTGATVVVGVRRRAGGPSPLGLAARGARAWRRGSAACARSGVSRSRCAPRWRSPDSCWCSRHRATTGGSTGSRRRCPAPARCSWTTTSARRTGDSVEDARRSVAEARARPRHAAARPSGAPGRCRRRCRSGHGSTWPGAPSCSPVTGWSFGRCGRRHGRRQRWWVGGAAAGRRRGRLGCARAPPTG